MSADVAAPPETPRNEAQLRRQLAACYRIFAMLGWTELIYNHISVRVPGPEVHFLINPFGLHYTEVCASNLVKIDLEGRIAGTSAWRVNPAGFVLHSTLHRGIAGAHCVMHTHTTAGSGSNLSYHNGPVIRSAHVVSIFWGPSWGSGNDKLTADHIVAFFGQFAGQSWGKAILAFSKPLVVPFGLHPIKTPYGGVFELNTALSVRPAVQRCHLREGKSVGPVNGRPGAVLAGTGSPRHGVRICRTAVGSRFAAVPPSIPVPACGHASGLESRGRALVSGSEAGAAAFCASGASCN